MNKILISQAIHFDKKRKTYYDQLDIRLIKTFYKLGFQPITISNFFLNPSKFLNNLNIKGIVLSGGSDLGKSTLRDNNDLELISYGIKKKIPIFGICRGMQVINKYFNGRLKKIKNHVRKKHLIENFSKKKKFFVNSYHNYAIDPQKLNKNLKPIFICKKDKSIEAFLHNKDFILGIMWHPEREKVLKKFDKKTIKDFFLKSKNFRNKYTFKK